MEWNNHLRNQPWGSDFSLSANYGTMATWQFSEIIGNSHTVQSYAICGLKQYRYDLDIDFHADLWRP